MSKTLEELKREMEKDCEECPEKAVYLKTSDGPIGRDPNSSSKGFQKFDSGKIMASLVDWDFVLGIANTMTGGAEKYGIDNWKLCEDPRRYKDALLRHLFAYLSGEEFDPESGLPHLYHVGFNTMAINYFDRKRTRSMDEIQRN